MVTNIMTAEQYLNELLESQKLTDKELELIDKHRIDIENLLRKHFGSTLNIRYGGSKAKHTMIKDDYDLDLLFYFPSTSDLTLKEIYLSTQEALESIYSVLPKSSALRINFGESSNFHIDIVPGKYIDENNDYAFLYLSDVDKERIQTNVEIHVNHISNSGCREVIKLMKLWEVRNNLSIRTFILEIFVIKALHGIKSKSLFESFKIVLESLSKEIRSVRLEDPANSNNIVSNLLSEADKGVISSQADYWLKLLNNTKYSDVENLELMFQDKSAERSVRVTPISVAKPEEPWHA